jgi:hypothetical protein
MDDKDILINKLKEALVRMIADRYDFFKEREDVLHTNPTEEYRKFCVICNECQNMDKKTIASNNKPCEESSGT